MIDFDAEAFDQRVELHWSCDTSVGYTIRRSLHESVRASDEGEFVYTGSGAHMRGLLSDRGLTNGTTYFYSIFSIDKEGNYSSPVTTSATPQRGEVAKNLVQNGGFVDGIEKWKVKGNYQLVEDRGWSCVRMMSSAQLSQKVGALEPKTLYTATMYAYGSSVKMAPTMRVDGNVQHEVSYSYIDKDLLGYWKEFRFVFWSDESEHPEVNIKLIAPKVEGDFDKIYVQYTNIGVQKGVQPMPDRALDRAHPLKEMEIEHPCPKLQANSKVWDFTKGVFDPDQIAVSDQKNSVPENLALSEQGLMITAYGDQDEKHPRQGSIIMTRDYFCSGRYDVWVKIGPVFDKDGEVLEGQHPIGCCFAMWPFSYIQYMDGQPQWYDQPSCVRNSEIDIEMPGNVSKDETCPPPIFWHSGRLNAWGGQRGGIGGDAQQHLTMPDGINGADGKFHKYTIEWYAGDDIDDGSRIAGWVKWYIDDKLWGELHGNTYGFDDIPYRCCRFSLGAWFPSAGYGSEKCRVDGWAGSANWARAQFIVQKIEYTPLKSNRNRWESESFPNYIWSPDRYPKS